MRVPLASRPYQERSLIAGAQRSINLYAELNTNDPQAPVPVTYYPFFGSVLYSQIDLDERVRATYRTSIGTAYVVIGSSLYFLASNKALVFVGTITDRQSQVYMADNGDVLVLVDGANGWVVKLSSNAFSPIIDPSFYGADFVVYLDTFFVFNRPATNQFYISLSNVDYALLSGTSVAGGTITDPGTGYVDGSYGPVFLTGGSGTGCQASFVVSGGEVTSVTIDAGGVGYLVGDVLGINTGGGAGADFAYTVTSFALAFDPLDIAAKSGSADPIVGISTVHKELWLIGALTTEVWIGTGSADFYFQLVQGAYIDHGCGAQYSIANQDISVFFIMQDKQGKGIVVEGSGYQVKEISTPAIVAEFRRYSDMTDAIGFCFQQDDHAFYCLAFPTANKTWAYDLTTKMWNEWAWSNTDGVLQRSRANCCMFAYGSNVIGDWEKGILWELDGDVFTNGDPSDTANTVPMIHVRSFMHIMDDGNRIVYSQFIADMECGNGDGDTTDMSGTGSPFSTGFSTGFGPLVQYTSLYNYPAVSLRWSDDRGKSYGNAIIQSLGRVGEYLTQPQWNRLGYARDRVFELSWSSKVKTSLNGAFIDFTPSKS